MAPLVAWNATAQLPSLGILGSTKPCGQPQATSSSQGMQLERNARISAARALSQCTEVPRRQFGVQLLLIPVVVNSILLGSAAAFEQQSSDGEQADLDGWDEYKGDGFIMRVPPGFEDTIEPNEYPTGQAPLYGYQPKPNAYAARFASPDREEFLSVVIRRTSQLKRTFFTAKSITDLGDVNETAKLFLPVGARLTAASAVTSTGSNVPRVYYLYEYLVADTHVFLSTAANNGQVFVAAATAPESRWGDDGGVLSSAAASFSLI